MSPRSHHLLTAAACTAALGAGCSTFSTVTTMGGVTTTTFDNRAPAALEEVFATCDEPLSIEDGDTEVDLRGSCASATELDTVEAQTVFALLATEMPMELGAEVPSHLTTYVQVLDGFPWPVQNCEVTVTANAYFDRLKLYDLDAAWTTHDGDPSLHIDFDFNGTQNVGRLIVDVDVDCPSGLSEWLIETFKGRVIDELDGTHTIRASSMDLDIWVQLDHGTSSITGALDLDFDVDSVDLGVNWSLIDEIDGDEVEEEARATMEDEADAMLEDSLSALADTTAELLEMAIPSGHIVCSLAESSGSLRLRTDTPGVGQCLTAGPYLPFP